jgi:hypothetical protein
LDSFSNILTALAVVFRTFTAFLQKIKDTPVMEVSLGYFLFIRAASFFSCLTRMSIMA